MSSDISGNTAIPPTHTFQWPAFPSHGSMGEVVHHGLTKRELFAAMMMQGMLADPECNPKREVLARDAVSLADALLAQLAGNSQGKVE